MKIIFIVKYYDNYRSSFYSGINNLENYSYDELTQKFVEDYFSFYSSLIQIMRSKGHDAQLIIPNCEIIREKWTKKINQTKLLTDKEFILSAVNCYQPDVIFLNSNFEYFGNFLIQLKKQCKALCCWISCPYDKTLYLNDFSEIFTLFPPHLKDFNDAGIKAKLVTAGFDPAVLKSCVEESSVEKIPFSFIGGIGGFHKKREHYLKKICAKTPLQIWGYGFSSDNKIKKILKNVRSGFSFVNHYHGESWGLNMFRTLQRSKITLNIHGDIADQHSVNMRLFEATGMGTLLLTDHSDNISNLFIPDLEIVTFRTPEEAIEKYTYYITHNEEREKIARAGQKKTLEHYNYTRIADIFIDEFKKLIT